MKKHYNHGGMVIRRLAERCNMYNSSVISIPSGVPRNIFRGGGGVQHIQLRIKDRENGDLEGGSPLVRGSGGNCNLVQEISFHIVKYS